MFRLFLVVSLLLFSSLHGLDKVDITHGSKSYFGQNITFLEDKTTQLEFRNIRALESSEFKPLNRSVAGEFFTSSAFWYKFEVNNKKESSANRYFVFDMPWIDEIQITILHQGSTQKYIFGNLYNFEHRSKESVLLNQLHDFKPGISTVYLRVETRDPFIIPFSLLTQEDFNEKIYRENRIEFSIYSIIMAMLLFNFILFFIIRNNSYLYYCYFLLSYILMSMSYNGYTFMLLFSENSTIQNWIQSFTIYNFVTAGLLFARSFLNLKAFSIPLDRAILAMITLFIILGFGLPVFGYGIHVEVSIFLTVIFPIFTIILAVYAMKNGNQSALYFLIGTVAGLIGSALTAFSVMSIIPYHWALYRAVDFGLTIDTILLSVALAKRYSLLYTNLQRTEGQLAELNTKLEQRVTERTEWLDRELKNKNVLLKELSHRVKNNLQIISALFSIELRKVDDLKAKEVLEENINRVKSIASMYESMIEEKDLKRINLNTFINGLITEIKKTMNLNEIRFVIDCHDIEFSTDNLMPISLIINELVVNSVKHGFKGEQEIKQINIMMTKKDSSFELIYRDNGMGANLEKLEKGFGLDLLNSLVVYQLDGELSYQNCDGLEFLFTLPKEVVS